MTDWIAYCAPGHVAEVRIAVAMGVGSEHGNIIDVQESKIIQHPTVILIADGLAIFYKSEQSLVMDDNPLLRHTPWADPWHDIAGDVRAAKRGAFEHRDDPSWPLPERTPGSDDEEDNNQ